MHHIVFISSNYPSKTRPFQGVFLQNLIREIARNGVQCSVISPVSIFDRRYGKIDPKISIDDSIKNNYVKILRPRYISFSNKKISHLNTFRLTYQSFKRTIHDTLPYLDISPHICYGHFLYPAGASAVEIACKLDIPSIVAVGESSFWSIEAIGYRKAISDFKRVNGVIAVSSAIKVFLMEKLKIPDEKIIILPNGVDLTHFYPRDRHMMREKFGFPIKKFIIAFAGVFSERKGPHRLLLAVSGLDDIGLIFIGSGPIVLDGDNILFKGILEHSQIPEMLSAADIFVLPTIAEGSCNAIIEALACGLPVITSKGAFNDDIVDDSVSIRIDPLNIAEIREAVMDLYNNPLKCREMSLNALAKAQHYNINLRVKKIIEWIGYIKN
jgi:glycosyltransferase involved in cell wall biosynthesis